MRRSAGRAVLMGVERTRVGGGGRGRTRTGPFIHGHVSVCVCSFLTLQEEGDSDGNVIYTVWFLKMSNRFPSLFSFVGKL